MIQLRVNQLKEFGKFTNSITTNSLLPILSNLRLSQNGVLTKSNLASTCSMKIEIQGELKDDLLLNQITLFSLLSKTQSEFIYVKYDDKKVYISDGKSHLNHAREDITFFPALQETPKAVWTNVSKEILDTIRTAKEFISKEENSANFRALHINKNYIAALDFHYMYIKEFPFELPNIILMDNECDLITQFDKLTFYQTDRHYFFKYAAYLTYIFTKTEFKTPDLEDRLQKIKSIESHEFTIRKSDLIDFCEMANNLTTSKQVICSFTKDLELGAILKRQDDDYVKGAVREIEVNGEIEEFNFNSRITLSSLRAIPTDTLVCKVAQSVLIITFDGAFACFMGVKI